MRNEWEYDELEDFIAEHTDAAAAAGTKYSSFAMLCYGALARMRAYCSLSLPFFTLRFELS